MCEVAIESYRARNLGLENHITALKAELHELQQSQTRGQRQEVCFAEPRFEPCLGSLRGEASPEMIRKPAGEYCCEVRQEPQQVEEEDVADNKMGMVEIKL